MGASGTQHEGKVAIVTGAASGIGRSAVERLVAEGASVVASDVSADGLAWTDALADVQAVPGDAADEADNAHTVDAAIETFGRLDIAVLNAGMPMRGDLVDLPLEHFDAVMDLNVRGVLLGMRASVPAMRAVGGGAIVATASTSGIAADPGLWAYNTSKAAVINLVRGAALDLAVNGIRVNAVCPGPTITGMTTALRSSPASEELRRKIPLQRWGRSEELAAAISFLASDDASFITGVALPVDGGIGANTGQFLPTSRSEETS